MDDGFPLVSAAHPRPPWYMRPYWALRCWWSARFGFRNTLTEEVYIYRGEHKPLEIGIAYPRKDKPDA